MAIGAQAMASEITAASHRRPWHEPARLHGNGARR